MNEQVERKLVESIDQVQQYIEGGANFVAEQVPLVVQEIITWGMAQCLIWICVWICVCLVGVAGTIHLRHVGKRKEQEEEEGDVGYVLSVISRVIAYATSCVFIVSIGICIYDLCFIYFAPRLYVLETISGLIK
jgi:hypothetical protein